MADQKRKDKEVQLSDFDFDVEALKESGKKAYQTAKRYHKPNILQSISYYVLCIDRNRLAIQYYSQACTDLKKAQDWELGALSHMELAEVYLDTDQKQEAASSYVEAGKTYSHIAQMQNYASEAYQNAAEIHVNRGKPELAAKLLKRAAEWSANGHKVEQAIQLYDDSAALYAKINQPIQKTQITLRIAEVRVIEENYLKAVRRYEEAAKRYLKSERYTLGAKNVVVNIVLCHLANGKIKKAKGTINRYKGLDKTFKGSKQCLFLTAIVKAYSSDDIVAFDEQCEWMMDVITMDTQRNKLYEEIRQQLATTDEEKRRAKKRADQAERQRLALEEEQPPPPPVEIPEGINQAIQRLEMGG
eukprot:TRINITY_DN3072_c0_g2_i10.p2 TRINITY_DN3072_c0_g2~~TRINITY_DN3072_c0_g2_i10.p2  ORF type:complete len:392 (+),score=72.59 TRINITY_DN3072_c0_g2_i10:101-1177(+)